MGVHGNRYQTELTNDDGVATVEWTSTCFGGLILPSWRVPSAGDELQVL
jgi:hypothetical protein